MHKKFIVDNTAYLHATMAVMVTIMLSYILFISILPASDMLMDELIRISSHSQFYSPILEERLGTSMDLGWKMPFGFIVIGFVYIVVRTIVRQRYTRYSEDDY